MFVNRKINSELNSDREYILDITCIFLFNKGVSGKLWAYTSLAVVLMSMAATTFTEIPHAENKKR